MSYKIFFHLSLYVPILFLAYIIVVLESGNSPIKNTQTVEFEQDDWKWSPRLMLSKTILTPMGPMFFCRMWTKGSRQGKMKKNEGCFITLSPKCWHPKFIDQTSDASFKQRLLKPIVGNFPPLLPHGPRGYFQATLLTPLATLKVMLGSEDLQVEDPMIPKSGTARLHEVQLCEEALRGFGMEKILLQLGPF